MEFKILLLALVAITATVHGDFQDDVREMRKLDQEKLLTALKHENLKDHVELDEQDQEFLSKVSKDELRELMSGMSDDVVEDKDVDEDEYEENDADVPDGDSLELAEAVDEEMEDLDKMESKRRDPKADPWGRRRRRRRRWFPRINLIPQPFRGIKSWLQRHRVAVGKTIRAVRHAIYICCRRIRKCRGKWWCRLGKAWGK
uniref:Cnidarian restricted protein n=1 Tax=Clytia hemisphaerica TaxID=252671 RepID=A0A7M5UP86_9CNID